MKFLDRKEQVLDIQLTQHGKRMLAQGVLKPHYYAFYDDDIIYDVEWAGHSEDQNDAQGRILESVRPEAQYNFVGVETKINEKNEVNGLLAQNESDRDLVIAPLSTADPFSEYAPSWDVKFLDGKINSFNKTYQSGTVDLRIPQLEVLVNYDIKITDTPEVDSDLINEEDVYLDPEGMTPEDDHPGFQFPDGTSHFVDDSKGQMFIKLLENNTEFLDENFDIEVFKLNEDDELEKLQFMNKRQTNIKNGILLDEPPTVEVLDFGPQYVEYYFDLLVDSEIPDEIYCKAISNNVLEDIYSDKELFNCDDLEQDKDFSDLYRISKEIDEDPC